MTEKSLNYGSLFVASSVNPPQHAIGACMVPIARDLPRALNRRFIRQCDHGTDVNIFVYYYAWSAGRAGYTIITRDLQ